jgi:hypothetical protein
MKSPRFLQALGAQVVPENGMGLPSIHTGESRQTTLNQVLSEKSNQVDLRAFAVGKNRGGVSAMEQLNE